jgi:hypothetical protein
VRWAPGLDYTCRECGRGGQIHSDRRCFGCVLGERARILLTGPGGDVPAQLQPLLEALSTVTNPATVVKWLGTSRSARLLGRLARTGGPVTHDLLDDLPQTQSLHYVREVLVSSGVLPPRNTHLERLAPWLEHLLSGKPAHHARLVRPFTHWFVLRRARRAAARRTFTRGSADFARARVLVALDLLSWLDQRGQDLRDLTQADLDQWLTGGATTRRAVRYFLQWAHTRSPARPTVDVLFGVRLHRYGINAHAGRNTGRLALAAELPASVLADLTGISISTAERWSHWAKRDWAAYVGQRAADVAAEPGRPMNTSAADSAADQVIRSPPSSRCRRC